MLEGQLERSPVDLPALPSAHLDHQHIVVIDVRVEALLFRRRDVDIGSHRMRQLEGERGAGGGGG